MIHRVLVCCQLYGIHARVAAELHQLAATYRSSIFLRTDTATASLASTTSVMKLAIGHGDSFILMADGDDEVEAANAVENYLTGPVDNVPIFFPSKERIMTDDLIGAALPDAADTDVVVVERGALIQVGELVREHLASMTARPPVRSCPWPTRTRGARQDRRQRIVCAKPA